MSDHQANLKDTFAEHVEDAGAENSEIELSTEVAHFWALAREARSKKAMSANEYREVRSRLGESLAEMKALLSRPGRGGGWLGFLKSQHIPRSTADGLVDRHLASIDPEKNCPSRAINSDPVQALFDLITKRLYKALTTADAASRFIEMVALEFNVPIDRRDGKILVVISKLDEV